MNSIKTTMLMALLMALMVALGGAFAGHTGMTVMLIIALGMNFFSYWFSDRMVLSMYNAQEVDRQSAPELYGLVEKLAGRAELPMPRVYIINEDAPNAFATGRNPSNAAVAVTTGLMRALDYNEISGVLGHELAHVKHRDILISTIAATMATVISYAASIAQWAAIFGSGRSSDDDNNGGIIGLIATGGASIMVYVWFAFAGAALTSVLVHRLGRTGRSGVDPGRLVLAGAALSIVLSALTRALILSADATVYESFRSWATGSLQGRGWESLPVVGTCLVVGLLISLALAGPLDSVSLGTDMATALGVNIRLTWTLANAAIVVLAGGATAACGPIAFIGLASPHIARAVSGPNHRLLLPVSALLAAVLLLLADVIGRIVVFPGEIGAGVMTALIGSPFFIHLVRRGRVVGI